MDFPSAKNVRVYLFFPAEDMNSALQERESLLQCTILQRAITLSCLYTAVTQDTLPRFSMRPTLF